MAFGRPSARLGSGVAFGGDLLAVGVQMQGEAELCCDLARLGDTNGPLR